MCLAFDGDEVRRATKLHVHSKKPLGQLADGKRQRRFKKKLIILCAFLSFKQTLRVAMRRATGEGLMAANTEWFLRNKTNKKHFLYVVYSEKCPLHVSNRQAVHPQEALFTVYADIGTYHVSTVTSC